ncbi:MAG: family 43 glycosylhydrolase [Candidatus Acidiferrum sp.]
MLIRHTLLIPVAVAALVCASGFAILGDDSQNQRRVRESRLERIPQADLGNGYFHNPVLVGPGADNTILKVANDYYMMAGGGWPDQLIWHSRDLINWAPVVRALRKFDGYAWATELTYYNGKFYIYTTQVDPSRGNVGPLNVSQRSLLGVPFKNQGDHAWKNVVMWADHVEGPWSDPIDLGVYGLFDPGHVVDQQGNRYLYFNKGMMIRLAPDGLSTVGELKKVYDGWDYPTDWVIECKCLEAPKLIFHDGYYYLTSAEGGTSGPSTAHMSIVARSKSVEGPWENSPYNPLVHTNSQYDKWWRQGHGTFVQDGAGKWWFLYTGYENGFALYGKQSLLLPIEWTSDGWPRVPLGVLPTDLLSKPPGENVGHGMPLSDNFLGTTLGIQWMYAPSSDPKKFFKISAGKLVMQAAGALPGDAAIPPSDATMLGIMPVNHAYQAEVEISIPDSAEGGLFLSSGGREAGSWATVGIRKGKLFATWAGQANYVPSEHTHIFVRLRNMNYDVSAFYSLDGKSWIPFDNSTRVTDGRRLFLYAAGAGEVEFRNFQYRGLD